MDLLFFANTRHLKRADARLATMGLGRAHHRVLYFVQRKPGLPLTELLNILGVSKQSFGRVSHYLTERGLMEARQRMRDRRERLLYLTPAGEELEREIFGELHDNVLCAYTASGGEAVRGLWIVLPHLIGDEGREQFRALNERL